LWQTWFMSRHQPPEAKRFEAYLERM